MVMLAFRMIHASLDYADPALIMSVGVMSVLIMIVVVLGMGVDSWAGQVRQRHRQKRKGQAEDEKLNGWETAHSLQ